MSDQFNFGHAVRQELAMARKKFAPVNSFHEGYAILHEELEEFWEQVRLWPVGHSPCAMRKELIQIGAMAQRISEDLCADDIARETEEMAKAGEGEGDV